MSQGDAGDVQGSCQPGDPGRCRRSCRRWCSATCATYDLTNVPYAVLDQSRSAASAELLARLDGTGVFGREAHADAARPDRRAIDEGKSCWSLTIPRGLRSPRWRPASRRRCRSSSTVATRPPAGSAAARSARSSPATTQCIAWARRAITGGNAGPGTTRTSSRAGISCRR